MTTTRTHDLRLRRRLPLLGGLAAAGLLLAGCGNPDGTLQMPLQASEQAKDVDWVYYFIFWLNAFYFIHIMGVMAWFGWRYRRRPGVAPEPSPHHNLPLEIAWSLPPIVLVVVMFYWGFKGYVHLQTAPSDAVKVEVLGKKWAWNFTYPATGGSSEQLHVMQGQPVKLIMESEDVLHSFYIPTFRVKKDVVPGRFSSLWFTANRPGEYHVYCAEYCGDQHSMMRAEITVHPDTEEGRAEYQAFLASTTVMSGESLYRQNCQACHSLEGTIVVGPSFRGLFGSQRKVLEAGAVTTITADEAYIRESILDPGAKLSREGREFDDQMSAQNFAQRLEPEEVDMLVEFIKGLGEK